MRSKDSKMTLSSWKGMCLTGIVAFVFMLLVLPVRVKAADYSKLISEATKAKTVQCDMTGDGVKDRITVTPLKKKSSDYEYNRIRVTVNGATAATIDVSDFYWGLDVTYITLSSSKQFLQITTINEDDWIPLSSIYRYNKSQKKLVRVLSLNELGYSGSCERNGDQVVKVTSNTIQIKRNTQICETGFIEWYATYTYSGGKFKLKKNTAVQSWNSSNNTFTATKTLTFYKSTSLSKKSFTIQKGDKVKLVGVKTSNKKIYLKFKYGNKVGWQKGGRSYSAVFNSKMVGWFKEARLAG